MQDIKSFSPKELESIIGKWGMPKFHSRQVLDWIYQKGITDFAKMSNLPQGLRDKLKEYFYILGAKEIRARKSSDGTEKLLLELKDKELVECVKIPAQRWITGCVSTQVGCKFACKFCASGVAGFKRNLTAAEILDEVLYLNRQKQLTRIVFMGTGEPLDNYDNVLKAVRIINADYAFNIGARRITISTCGIIPGIKRLAEECLQIELSISLHAADEALRSKILPVNKIYPIAKLIPACKDYIQQTNRQVTFEYVLIKGLNSSRASAAKLSRLLKGLKLAKVNLIPANPVPQLGVVAAEKEEIRAFRDYLIQDGVNVTLRKPRGEDIEAACGQLLTTE